MDESNNTTQERSASLEQPSSHSKSGSSLAIPLAIVIGFGMVAAAIMFSNNQNSNNPTITGSLEQEVQETTSGKIRPVDENDHIRGNPNAPIMIVEYSDYDCPFCKNFHETMKQVIDNYGTTGEVAWVYRHFPLEQLHPSAPYIAAASECVANLGGNDAFWIFSDLIFSERGTNEPTKVASLPDYAEQSGVNKADFQACLDSGETKSLVDEDFADGIQAGAKGTPHSIITVGGQQGVINGAQPYEVVSQIIESLLTQVEQ